MPWVGPFTIGKLLDNCLDPRQPWPQEESGVYVVTTKAWKDEPDLESGVLYVGGLTGKSNRFVTRIGDLIADIHGFFGKAAGHHSGGQHLHAWCQEHRRHPGDLFIGWLAPVRCGRCAEVDAFDRFNPLLNRHRPPRCPTHISESMALARTCL